MVTKHIDHNIHLGNRDYYPKNRVLVTGGAGFLGSHLCEKLLNQDCEVICLDNFFTGRKANIAHLLDNPRFEVVRHDVTLPMDLEVDQIYHLACPASPFHYQYDPIKTMKTSVFGCFNVLDLARAKGAKVLFASTSEIYGDPTVHPQPETYWGNVNTVGVRSCYDEGKRVGETIFTDYRRQYGVDTRIVRIFNTYGPRMLENDGRVVSNFIVQALRGEPITIYGEGQQTRSFCYVDDLLEAMTRVMNTPGLHLPINIGNQDEFTIMELATLVLEMTGSKSQLVHKPLPPDDPCKRKPDITRVREQTGWSPVISLEEGLKPTIAYFKEVVNQK